MHARRALALGAVVTTVCAGLAAPTVAHAAPGTTSAAAPVGDTREVPPGKRYALPPDLAPAAQSGTGDRALAAAGVTPPVGTVREWVALDDIQGSLYRKDYTLRGVGAGIEVWVASDSDATSTGTRFPEGDCRNAVPGSTEVTDAQVASLVREFDTNILPKESAAFSVAPERDGSGAQLAGDYTGAGNRVVTLVDNVRDDNFYDFPARPTYIAGFFSDQINELLDRNVMTIDAFDWLHRTGADPANEPTDDLCTSRPARPFTYEGIFAHEYQHLLQYYVDDDEVNFVNEGLSDFAISLTGYGRPQATVAEPRAENHIYCFQGFGTVQTPFNTNPRDCGGPQNSLTLWGDEGDGNEILADYGNAWSFQLFLFDRYGQAFTSALHRDGEHQGLAGVQAALDRFARGTTVRAVLHDFQAMNLLDRYVSGSGGQVLGRDRGRLTTRSLNATVNLLNPTAYARPGAAPNGADYVGLRGAGATFLSGDDLTSVTFSGARTLPPLPLRWTVVADAPGRAGNPTLWSGNESNLDSTVVTTVAVPTGSPTLTYTERHLAEQGFDYAYTVVSADGGRTYTPLANANTVDGPLGPALNGESAAYVTQTFDLSAYAGRTVLLGLRYVSDGGVNAGGWFVDDVKVGTRTISDGSSLAAAKSPTQVRPVEVANWDVRLVGLDTRTGRARYQEFDGVFSGTLPRAQLDQLRGFPLVVAIVGYDDPTEQVQQYAPYTLTVNGVVQPGG